jgi:hypothetical protein
MDQLRDRPKSILERSATRWAFPRSVVAAGALGGAFGLGLVVSGGGNAHARGADVVSDAVDPIKDADEKTAAYEALVKSATSTWHAELTAPEATTTTARAPAPTPAPSPTTTATTTTPSTKPAAAPTTTKPATLAADDEAPAGHDADDDRADQEGDADRAPATRPEAMQMAIQKVLGDAAPAAAAERTYALQLASAGTPEGAAGIVKDFAGRGVSAVVVSAEIPGRGTVYRVRLVGMKTRAAADAMKAKLGVGLVVAEDPAQQ